MICIVEAITLCINASWFPGSGTDNMEISPTDLVSVPSSAGMTYGKLYGAQQIAGNLSGFCE